MAKLIPYVRWGGMKNLSKSIFNWKSWTQHSTGILVNLFFFIFKVINYFSFTVIRFFFFQFYSLKQLNNSLIVLNKAVLYEKLKGTHFSELVKSRGHGI